MAAVGNSTGLSTLDRSYCTNNDMAAAIRKHKEAKYHKAAVEAKVAHEPQDKHVEVANDKNRGE